MTSATISAFESTLQKTNIWLKDLLSELHWEDSDHERAYHAMRAVLHVLRDRLSVEEATDFAAQLPMLIRGFYYEGWNPTHTPSADHNQEQFLEKISAQFITESTTHTEEITRAVFRVINKHVTSGEIDDIKSALPKPIRELWE
jgi:uncharacterized protein (DUF2267 family)